MKPEELGIEAEDFDSLQKDKFTQTDSGSPLWSELIEGEIEKADQSSVTVFEYCQITQNPDIPISVTIIKETVKGESTSNLFDDKTIIYKHRKQISHPFVRYKSDCLECEDDDILQAALALADNNYTCYQPRIEILDSEINRKRQDEVSDVSLPKVSAYTSYSSMDCEPKKEEELPLCEEEEEVEKRPKCPPKPPRPEPEPERCEPKCSWRDPDCPGQPPTCHPRDPDCLPPDEFGCEQKPPPAPEPEPKSKCKSKGKCGKKSSMSSVEIGTPIILASTVSDTEKLEKQSDVNQNDEDVPCPFATEYPAHEKTFKEAHNEVVTTIKVAMEDVVGRVYQSAQDTVSVILTESGKQLIKTKASEIFSKGKEGNVDEDGSKSRILGLFRKNSLEEGEKYGPGAEAIRKIITAVDSAVTVTSQRVTEKIDKFPDKIKASYEKSSPYDKPKPTSDVRHTFVPDPEPNHSVFSVIKSKIFSMFGESEAKVEDVLDREPSTSTNKDEDDTADIIEKIID